MTIRKKICFKCLTQHLAQNTQTINGSYDSCNYYCPRPPPPNGRYAFPRKGLHHSFIQGERRENLLCVKQYFRHQKYSNEQKQVPDTEKLTLVTDIVQPCDKRTITRISGYKQHNPIPWQWRRETDKNQSGLSEIQKLAGKQTLLKHPGVLRCGLCALSLGPLITRLGNQNKLELQLVIQNSGQFWCWAGLEPWGSMYLSSKEDENQSLAPC